MGGKKRRISMEKIKSKDSRAVAFSKRRKRLYSKTSELCLLSGAQVAILATPVSSNSNVSFYSFGHSSVDSVVSAFLSGQNPPREDVTSIANKGLGFWWEDESLSKSENSEELSDAVDEISSMLQNLKGLHSKAVKNQEDLKKKDHQELGHNQTLNLQNDSSLNLVAVSDNNNNDDDNGLLGKSSVCNEEFTLDQIFDLVTKSEGVSMDDTLMHKDQTVSVSDNNSNNNNGDLKQELDLDQNTSFVISSKSLMTCSASDSESTEAGAMVIHSNSDEDHIVASSDNNNNNNNDLSDGDLDQVFDFVSSSECLSMNWEMDDVSMMVMEANQAVEDGAMVVIRKDLAEDDLHFSDVFNE